MALSKSRRSLVFAIHLHNNISTEGGFIIEFERGKRMDSNRSDPNLGKGSCCLQLSYSACVLLSVDCDERRHFTECLLLGG